MKPNWKSLSTGERQTIAIENQCITLWCSLYEKFDILEKEYNIPVNTELRESERYV